VETSRENFRNCTHFTCSVTSSTAERRKATPRITTPIHRGQTPAHLGEEASEASHAVTSPEISALLAARSTGDHIDGVDGLPCMVYGRSLYPAGPS
jgi:hypothetical protein